MAAAVDIFLKDDSAQPEPIADATVVVLNDVTKNIYAIVQTDEAGMASFAVPAGTYEVRLFKTGIVFGKPSRIVAVDGGSLSNTFDLTGHKFEVPPSIDPMVCRCTGRFVDISNRPLAGVTVRIMPFAEEGTQEPETVDGSQVVGGFTRQLMTSQDGRVTVDLVRGGKYHITWAGEDNTTWEFEVPDRLSADLIALIHPAPKSVTWDSTVAPGGILNLAVGETVEVPVAVLFSDFKTRTEGLSQWLQATLPNTSVRDADGRSVVVVSGVEAGSFQVHLSTRRAPPVALPTSKLLPTSLTVVVSP